MLGSVSWRQFRSGSCGRGVMGCGGRYPTIMREGRNDDRAMRSKQHTLSDGISLMVCFFWLFVVGGKKLIEPQTIRYHPVFKLYCHRRKRTATTSPFPYSLLLYNPLILLIVRTHQNSFNQRVYNPLVQGRWNTTPDLRPIAEALVRVWSVWGRLRAWAG